MPFFLGGDSVVIEAPETWKEEDAAAERSSASHRDVRSLFIVVAFTEEIKCSARSASSMKWENGVIRPNSVV